MLTVAALQRCICSCLPHCGVGGKAQVIVEAEELDGAQVRALCQRRQGGRGWLVARNPGINVCLRHGCLQGGGGASGLRVVQGEQWHAVKVGRVVVVGGEGGARRCSLRRISRASPPPPTALEPWGAAS